MNSVYPFLRKLLEGVFHQNEEVNQKRKVRESGNVIQPRGKGKAVPQMKTGEPERQQDKGTKGTEGSPIQVRAEEPREMEMS